MMQTTTAVVRKVQNLKHTFWSNPQLTLGSSSAPVLCQQGRERAGCILLLPALEIGQWKPHKVGLLHLTAPEVLLRSIKRWYHPHFIWKSQPSCQPFALDAHKDEGVLSCWVETHMLPQLSPLAFPLKRRPSAQWPAARNRSKSFWKTEVESELAVVSKEEMPSLNCPTQGPAGCQRLLHKHLPVAIGIKVLSIGLVPQRGMCNSFL